MIRRLRFTPVFLSISVWLVHVAAAQPAPTLTPDAEGYCQHAEFLGWSSDGVRAALAESYCRQPPPDAAFDTLFLVSREGRVLHWFIGPEAGASLPADTRARLVFGETFRRSGAKSPSGDLTARATVTGVSLAVSFLAKDTPAPAPMTREVKLPYPEWPLVGVPLVGEIFWSPDGGALAVTVKALRREPGGGTLAVAAVALFQLKPLPKASTAGMSP